MFRLAFATWLLRLGSLAEEMSAFGIAQTGEDKLAQEQLNTSANSSRLSKHLHENIQKESNRTKKSAQAEERHQHEQNLTAKLREQEQHQKQEQHQEDQQRAEERQQDEQRRDEERQRDEQERAEERRRDDAERAEERHRDDAERAEERRRDDEERAEERRRYNQERVMEHPQGEQKRKQEQHEKRQAGAGHNGTEEQVMHASNQSASSRHVRLPNATKHTKANGAHSINSSKMTGTANSQDLQTGLSEQLLASNGISKLLAQNPMAAFFIGAVAGSFGTITLVTVRRHLRERQMTHLENPLLA